MNRQSCGFTRVLYSVVVSLALASAATAEERAWQVSKSSGDVWVTGPLSEHVSLADTTTLKSGDEIRTGRNGRVMLVRGEETILISPNSVLELPAEKAPGAETVLAQKAGELVFKVEKQAAPHFEVQTPFLAALVKGTQFRVTVDRSGSKVDVLEGRVQVSDFKTGQFALVLPGQAARVDSTSHGGLGLSGSGALGPVQQGEPRASSVTRVPIPRKGLSAPSSPAGGQQEVRAIGGTAHQQASDQSSNPDHGRRNGAIRITAPLGAVNLDVAKATKGLARATNGVAKGVGKSKSARATVWSSDALSDGNGIASNSGNGNYGQGKASAGGAESNGKGNSAAAHAAIAASNKNGNNGNGNGKGKGKNKG